MEDYIDSCAMDNEKVSCNCNSEGAKIVDQYLKIFLSHHSNFRATVGRALRGRQNFRQGPLLFQFKNLSLSFKPNSRATKLNMH